MRIEDAISTLKHEKPICDTRGCGKTLCDAVDMAIEALDKQIPKKPKMYVGEYEHERYPLCPACGGELMPNGEKYCSDCGQKISWED